MHTNMTTFNETLETPEMAETEEILIASAEIEGDEPTEEVDEDPEEEENEEPETEEENPEADDADDQEA